MKEVKDPEIKLFGKKICLMDNGDILHAGEEFSGDDSKGNSCELLSEVEESGTETENEDEKIGFTEENCKSLPEEKKQDVVLEESQNIEAVSVCEDSGPGSTSMDEVENDQGDMNTDNSQQKALKKPDKILPCPRCNSMDTKFCYYNNYNVNQPRHFCKSCQRYWTAGGTMRNVPVGAGRRKNKNFPSNCHSITISEALQTVQMDAPNGFHHPNFRPNGSILTFGQDLPLCDPVSSVLNMTNKNTVNGGSNGFYKLDPVTSACGKGVGNGTDCSSLKVHQGANNGQQEPVLQQMNRFSSPVPYLPGVPWPYPWNPAVPMQAFCPPGYHMPIYPTPLWNCNMNGPWSFPWLLPNSSSTLGKHSRNGEVIRSQESEGGESQEPKCSEGSVLVPKTLRIDDPEEAAKSSIWTTLGITYDSMSNKRGLFKAFEQKTSEKKCSPSAAPALQVNPAALSRSLIFQERA